MKGSLGARRDRRRAVASSIGTVDITRDGIFSVAGYKDSYDATRRDRLSTQRKRRGGKADLHLTPLALWDLREVSRDLERNSNLVSGAMDRLVENVVYNGFTYSADTGDEAFDKEVNAYVAEWFDACDLRREFHYWDLVALDERSNYRDGDALWWLDASFNGGRGGVLHIEGDRLIDPKDRISDTVHGIRRGEFGQPVEYHIADEAPRYPTSWAKGEWFPVYDHRSGKYADGGVLHSYDIRRTTQTRGLPWFTPSIREVDDVDAIMVAERVAMRLSASRATYETITDPEMFEEWSGVDPESIIEGIGEEDFLPGQHSYRAPGTEFGTVEHNRPGDNFQQFIETNLRMFGLPAGLPIELVLLDFSRPNFSAQRLALQNAYRCFIRRQVTIDRRRVTPIRKFALARAMAIGALRPPAGMAPERVFKAAPQFPRWPYIRPNEDAKANAMLVDAKLKTRRDAIAETSDGSRTPEEIMAAIDAEQQQKESTP